MSASQHHCTPLKNSGEMKKARASYHLRVATEPDTDAIKSLADEHRRELGFVLRPAIAFSIAEDSLTIASYDDKVIGYVRYHRRRDGITKVYEICVSSIARREGLGRDLIATVARRASARGSHEIVLKCPEDLSANEFYNTIGFTRLRVEPGKKRRLVVWSLQVVGNV